MCSYTPSSVNSVLLRGFLMVAACQPSARFNSVQGCAGLDRNSQHSGHIHRLHFVHGTAKTSPA